MPYSCSFLRCVSAAPLDTQLTEPLAGPKKTPLWGKGSTIFRFDHENARARNRPPGSDSLRCVMPPPGQLCCCPPTQASAQETPAGAVLDV